MQEIVAHSDSIWVAKFSPCGNYLATGGKDACLKVWQVRQQPNSTNLLDENQSENNPTRQQQQNAAGGGGDSKQIDLSLFESFPTYEFREHANDIVDISWNDSSQNPKKENHILSCSLDSIVLLWSLQSETSVPIAFFNHDEVPTSISFAPFHQDTFVSGCLDGVIRLWHIKKP